MNMSQMRGCLLAALWSCLSLAYAQKYEITPLVGARLGGTIELEKAATPNFKARLEDSVSFGVAGGYRFDSADGEGHDLIEFRWMRQNTHLAVKQDPLVATPYTALFRPTIAIDHFLGDFTHEFFVRDATRIQPFLTASVGAARMSAPASSATRFSFGIGGGVKIFPKTHWGFRVKVEYLPMLMHAGLQSVVCAGGCVIALDGGIMNQFEVSLGPALRF